MFLDYNRTIVGYHGTRASTAEALVLGMVPFHRSENNDDWLGHGIYFWEHAPRQALAWARRRYGNADAAVVASMIRLGHCWDLLDPENVSELEEQHRAMVETIRSTGRAPPKNVRSRMRLDCAVFQFAYESMEKSGRSIDTCRAVYVPTGSKGRVWKGSWINREAHIQICVRSASCILGTWLVKDADV